VGGSGSGKSVLLRSLIGLEKPSSGEIYFKARRIDQMSEAEWFKIRTQISYAFQGGALFDSMSVFDNLAYPLRSHTVLSEDQIFSKITSLLAEFNLQEAMELYPSQLSGGMQKRVGLARAIILGQDLILYDEPTAGLDPVNAKVIQNMILHLKSKGKTGIFVTHDLPIAFAVCDRIAFLKDQKLIAIDETQKILMNTEHPIQFFSRGEA
jgi:phospholipid/cholesterol/gamma-HCH transport system ATP-binding protein